MQDHLDADLSTISKSQSNSDSSVVINSPVSKVNLDLSAAGTSSAPKENSQPESRKLAIPSDCPNMRKPIPASETERIEHSAETEPLFRVATNLMRALDSIQPCANETTSLKDAEINALSFLLGCNYAEATRWYPFFKKSLQYATERPHDDTVETRGCGKRGSCPYAKTQIRYEFNSLAKV